MHDVARIVVSFISTTVSFLPCDTMLSAVYAVVCVCVSSEISLSSCIIHCKPLSSDRQHLSYGVCLEVRGEIIGTVLCCIVYDSCAQS